MGKVKPKYAQKFRDEWLKIPIFAQWLSRVDGDDVKALCKVCHCSLRARLADLENHAETKKHKCAASAFSSQRQTKISFKPVVDCLERNSAEGSIALFVSAHCAIMSCDHLGEMCKNRFKDSVAASQIKLHRTKCSAVIKNVLGPHFTSDLRSDIGDSMYSILVDESTDISVTKLLAIAIIYHSKTSDRIVSTFLSLAELEKCDAESIVAAIKYTLKEINLDLKKLQGIGTDNASVMVGINNGVYQVLKREIPHLILIRCVCHSIQLATSAATAESLPRNLDFLVRESYNWFSRSSSRQLYYRQIFSILNDGEEPLKIPQACDTRWLSIQPAVCRIIDQWLELKTHFEIVRLSEKCYTAEMLYSLFRDELNLAYLLFLKPILSDLQRINKMFESNDVDSCKLLNDLVVLIQSLLKQVVVPTYPVQRKYLNNDFERHLDPKPYLGYSFESKLSEIRNNRPITEQEEQTVRGRCIKFVCSLIKQLQQRLPDNIEILRKLSLLAVSKALFVVKEPLIPLLEISKLHSDTITKIELQWQKLTIVKWNNVNNSVNFWCEVSNYCDASGENPFKELADFALSRLVLPWSNAEVERIFSQLNLVKTKIRNRMRIRTVNAILGIRAGLRRSNQCCHNYELPASVLKTIGTVEAYKATPSTSTAPSTSADTLSSQDDENDDDLDDILHF